MSRAIVFDHARVIDGDVGCTLFEIGDGIATSVHEGGDEVVGLDDSAARVVDEAGLHNLPLADEAVAFGRGEIMDVEAIDALLASREGGLGIAFGTTLEDGAVILRAKPGAQMFGLLFALVDNDGNYHSDDHDKSNDANDESGVIRVELHRFNLLRGEGGRASPATSEMRLGECELNLGSTKGCSENWLPTWRGYPVGPEGVPPIMVGMRFPTKFFALVLAPVAIFACSPAAVAQAANSAGGRVVLVLPFDNHSGNASLNWIGDSFPDTLNKRLTSAGFLTISHDDRLYAYDHLGLPTDFRPTRATTIRIAEQLDANYVVIGSYTVVPGLGSGGANSRTIGKIMIQAKVLSVDALRLLPVAIEDSAELNRLFDVENAIAWKVASAMDPHFPVSEQTFLAAPGAVPLPAFEDYIRGINSTGDERLKRLKNAVSQAPNYPAALLELGKEQYAQRDFEGAAATLAKVPKMDPLALEANFYLGLAQFNSANYAGAQAAFSFVASRLPLPEVVNDEAVAVSRQGKDSVDLFRKASDADPSDEDYHYNLAVAMFRRGDTAGATREVEAALKLKPADNAAVELLAQLKKVPAGTKLNADAEGGFSPLERIRRNYSETGYRQAAFQLDQVRGMRMAMLPPDQRAAEYAQLGREYLSQGLLPEAETQFRNALQANPNSADAHAGMAQLREASGDAAGARDEAKTSMIMKPNVTALLVLARLDLADKKLAASAQDISEALKIDPKNADAIALKLVVQQRGQTVE